jgi:hypothetical protein
MLYGYDARDFDIHTDIFTCNPETWYASASFWYNPYYELEYRLMYAAGRHGTVFGLRDSKYYRNQGDASYSAVLYSDDSYAFNLYLCAANNNVASDETWIC